MTQEEKKLLLKVLCELLPYEVAIIPDGQITPHRVVDIDFNKEVVIAMTKDRELIGVGCLGFEDFKLVLRPMESMTEEELEEFDSFDSVTIEDSTEKIDWLNKKMFDYRGLIPKGLAVAVTKENNPYK